MGAFGRAAAGVFGTLAGLWASIAAAPADGPRVVSLDYCADQYVLALADRDQILAVSPGAAADYSVFQDRAASLRVVRPEAEAVLALRPDLVIRSYGGDPRLLRLLERQGVAIHQLPFVTDFQGARAALLAAAQVLGGPDRGEAFAARLDAQLTAAAGARGGDAEGSLRAIYLTAAGAVAGAGTSADAVLRAAGLRNAAAEAGEAGWRVLSLEALLAEPPDVYVTAFFDTAATRRDAWALSRHPVLRRRLAETPNLPVDSARMACADWTMGAVVEDLTAAARRMRPEGGAP